MQFPISLATVCEAITHALLFLWGKNCAYFSLYFSGKLILIAYSTLALESKELSLLFPLLYPQPLCVYEHLLNEC